MEENKRKDIKEAVIAGGLTGLTALTFIAAREARNNKTETETETTGISQVTETEPPTFKIFDELVEESSTMKETSTQALAPSPLEVKARFGSIAEYENYLQEVLANSNKDSWDILRAADLTSYDYQTDLSQAAAVDVLKSSGIKLENITPELETMLIMALNPSDYDYLEPNIQRIVDVYGEECNAFCALKNVAAEIYMQLHPEERFYSYEGETISKELNAKVKAFYGIDYFYYEGLFPEESTLTRATY